MAHFVKGLLCFVWSKILIFALVQNLYTHRIRVGIFIPIGSPLFFVEKPRGCLPQCFIRWVMIRLPAIFFEHWGQVRGYDLGQFNPVLFGGWFNVSWFSKNHIKHFE